MKLHTITKNLLHLSGTAALTGALLLTGCNKSGDTGGA